MDQLVNLIQERTGIDEAKARTAAQTAVDFLKDRLPEPIASQIDGVLGGGDGDNGSDNPLGGLGNLGGMTGG